MRIDPKESDTPTLCVGQKFKINGRVFQIWEELRQPVGDSLEVSYRFIPIPNVFTQMWIMKHDKIDEMVKQGKITWK